MVEYHCVFKTVLLSFCFFEFFIKFIMDSKLVHKHLLGFVVVEDDGSSVDALVGLIAIDVIVYYEC